MKVSKYFEGGATADVITRKGFSTTAYITEKNGTNDMIVPPTLVRY